MNYYAVYYKNILSAYGSNKLMAVFSAWDKAQEYADRMNDDIRDGYFVAKIKITAVKEN